MTKPKTLEEALQLVPEYILLRPGVDVWRKGDEQIVMGGAFSPVTRLTQFGDVVWGHGRRPIPADVRERMAKQILHCSETDLSDWPFESWLLQGGRND